jgi:hypothetical protein
MYSLLKIGNALLIKSANHYVKSGEAFSKENNTTVDARPGKNYNHNTF